MPYDFYNIAANRGRIAGQGLMAMGQGITSGLEYHRKAKLAEEEREERRKHRQFTKTLATVNLYTKMGDDLAPQERIRLYTGALLPMLAKSGGLPEGVKQEEVSEFIGNLSAQSKERMQGFRQDNDRLLEFVNEGKWKEADKFLSGMITEYAKLPGAKPFLKHAQELLKEEKKQRRERTEEQEDKIADWIAEGEVEEIPKTGLLTSLKDKGTMFEYGGRQFYRPEEKPELGFKEKERFKTDEAIRKAKATAGLKAGTEKPEVKESTAIKEMEAIKKGIDQYRTTGGLSSPIYAMLAASNPKFSEQMKGMSHDEAIEFMKKRYNYLYDNFVSEGKKTRYKLKRFEEERPEEENWRLFK